MTSFEKYQAIILGAIHSIPSPYVRLINLLVISGLFILWGYLESTFSGPGGIHYIRQTDSLAFIGHYYHFDAGFFEPGTFNLGSWEGKAACEFPLFYYLIAKLYLLVGQKVFILRILNLSLMAFGIAKMLKFLNLTTKNWLIALLITIALISSQNFVFFANSFLPDAAALGLTLFAFFDFLAKKNYRRITNTQFIAFALASLIKVTYFIYPFGLLCALLIHHIFENKSLKGMYAQFKGVIWKVGIVLLLALTWVFYIKYYNELHHDSYFLIEPRPIFSLSADEVTLIWEKLTLDVYPEYYPRTTFHALIVVGFLLIFSMFKRLTFMKILFCVMLVGASASFLLFFEQFKDHPYYFLIFLPLIILCFAIMALELRRLYFKGSSLLKYGAFIFLVILCVENISKVNNHLPKWYRTKNEYFSKKEERFKSLGSEEIQKLIPKGSKVVILGDNSMNGAALKMARLSFCVLENDCSIDMTNSIEKMSSWGANYMVLSKGVNVKIFPYKKKIFENNQLAIYSLQSF
jgi:hypothetical protein